MCQKPHDELAQHVDVPALLRAGAPRVISCYSVASSVVELVNSGLCEFDVAGFGTVAFPLTQAKAVKLVRSAKLASYGQVDNSVDCRRRHRLPGRSSSAQDVAILARQSLLA